MFILSLFGYKTFKMYTHLYKKLNMKLTHQVGVCKGFQIFLNFHVFMVPGADKLHLNLC